MGTPYSLVDRVVRSVCGRSVERLAPLGGGGMNETFRVVLSGEGPVVVRVARQPVPWFVDEAELMALAAEVGVPTPRVLGLEQLEHDGALLSFSVQQLLPGRPLDALAEVLPPADLEPFVLDAGELLARVHGLSTGRGTHHELCSPEEPAVSRAVRTVQHALGRAAGEVVQRGAQFLRGEVAARPVAPPSLVQGDFLPKNLLVHEGRISGVIDWEFAGPAAPAFDLARWEVSAGEPLHDRADLLRRGYARVADPDAAAAGLVPAFAVAWALEVLGWRNPTTAAHVRRCVAVIGRYTGAQP